MPATSAASLRRKARGFEKQIDPILSAKRKAAAAARWARQRGQDPAVIERARKGGQAAAAPKINRGAEAMHVAAFVQNLHVRLGATRLQCHAKAVEAAPEALGFLVALVRGTGDCEAAPHAVRRLAALDVLKLAGVAVETRPDDDVRPLNEFSAEELGRMIRESAHEVAALELKEDAPCPA
jgi:hypothetical protein